MSTVAIINTNHVAVQSVLAERQRQISIEGWTSEHDDQHDNGSLAAAAACYCVDMPSRYKVEHVDVSGGKGDTPVWRTKHLTVPKLWPESWDAFWWKPKDRRTNLVKAAALLLAEIERIDRAAAAQKK